MTAEEKHTNRSLSRLRIVVEHALEGVKRLRILKDTLRLRKPGVSDVLMEVGCSLHNLRVAFRGVTQPSSHAA